MKAAHNRALSFFFSQWRPQKFGFKPMRGIILRMGPTLSISSQMARTLAG